MPLNNNLKPITLPMTLKFNDECKTEFKNNLQSLNIELIDAPSREQAQKIAWYMTKSTWADSTSDISWDSASSKDKSLNLQDVLNFRALPTPMECLGFTFMISGINTQTVTHLIRHRAGSFAAQCTGDRDLRNDNILVPESVQNSSYLEKWKDLALKSKQLYADMVDSKSISMMDAREILPKCLETFYIARFNLKDLIAFIKQRQDVQIQPEVDNIIATKIAKIICQVIPEISTCMNFEAPDMHYIKTFRVELPDGSWTSRGTNLYFPEPKNDKFEFNENDAIYSCRREQLNGDNDVKINEEKIFTTLWNEDIEAINKIKNSLKEEMI